MLGPVTAFIRYRAEKYRQWCISVSKHKEKNETSLDIVTSEKIKLSLILFPIVCGAYATGLFFLLKKLTKLPKAAIWNISIGFFTLQPFYILMFVNCYDSFKRSLEKLKFNFFRLFKRSIYNDFSQQKRQLQREIHQVVNEMGVQVIDHFEDNRVIKQD